MITFRYMFTFSSVSVKFGNQNPDKSLVEGMLISFPTEKMARWRCKVKPLHGLNIYFGPVSTFKCFKID